MLVRRLCFYVGIDAMTCFIKCHSEPFAKNLPEGWNITDYKTVAAVFEKITPPPLCFYVKKSTIYCGDIFRSSCGVLPKVFLKVL